MRLTIKILWVVLLMLASCTRDPADSNIRNGDTGALSVEEARLFFEDYAGRFSQVTRSGKLKQGFKNLDPGEFTPNWGKARISQFSKLASVDVPIASDYRYRAVRSRFRNGHTEIQAVDIVQKLVVVKDLTTDSLGSYILTLIPDPSYTARHRDVDLCETFLNTGDKGEFSGIAIYTESSWGILVRVNRYRDGKKTAGIYIPGPPSERKERISRAKKLIGNIRFGRSSSISTRSWGEDDWDDDWDDDEDDNNDDNDISDDWIDLGFERFDDGYHQTWLDTDSFGYWVDFDDDGRPDTYIHLLDPDDTTNDNFPNEPDDDFCPFCGSSPCCCSDPCPICGSDPCSCPDDDSGSGETDNNYCSQCGRNPCICEQSGNKQLSKQQITKSAQQVVKSIPGLDARCNIGVRDLFQKLFGSLELHGKRANDMVDYWRTSTDWQRINGDLSTRLTQAQQLANNGWFVVAGAQDTPSGHVVVIVPGDMSYSPSWGMDVPNAMDTGVNKRYDSIPLSNSWRNSAKEDIEFYYYK